MGFPKIGISSVLGLPKRIFFACTRTKKMSGVVFLHISHATPPLTFFMFSVYLYVNQCTQPSTFRFSNSFESSPQTGKSEWWLLSAWGYFCNRIGLFQSRSQPFSLDRFPPASSLKCLFVFIAMNVKYPQRDLVAKDPNCNVCIFHLISRLSGNPE